MSPAEATTIALPDGDPDAWDDEPTVPAGQARPRHAAPRPGWFRRVLIGLVALLTIGTVAAGLGFAHSSPLPAAAAGAIPPPATPSSSAAPVTVQVDPQDYLGHPVSEVQTDLTSLGLTVQLHELAAADRPDHSVVSVDPTGELAPGMTVSVTYAVAPSAPTAAAGAANPSATAQPGGNQTAAPTSQSTAGRPGKGDAGRPGQRR